MQRAFSRVAFLVLFVNILVILWGAYVRATGSGAGCGSHWPLCNGEVIPRSLELETKIEFTHRLSSGVAFLGVVFQYLFARKLFDSRSPIRRYSFISLILIVLEALIGAGLVLFEWVADDASLGRAVSISVHLINTLLLLAALSLTWWASLVIESNELPSTKDKITLKVFVPIVVLFLGVSGAIAALGDTLFPANSLFEGIAQDFSETAHFLIRLRVYHPLIAVLAGGGVIYFLATRIMNNTLSKKNKQLTIGVIVLGGLQIVLGFINLRLMAPVWMQLVHLLVADLLWITYVLLLASIGIFLPKEAQDG